MKLRAEIGDESVDVELTDSGGEITAAIEGREYKLILSRPEPGVYLLKNDDSIYEVTVSDKAGDLNTVLNGIDTEIRIIDPRQFRGAGSSDGAMNDGKAEIKTAMPGKVVRIIAAAGQEIAKGDAVIVVEAMKMQNELRSPKDGIVKEFHVTEGQTVAAGELLAVIE